MKKILSLSLFFIFALLVDSAIAVEVNNYSGTFVRGSGSPVTETDTFSSGVGGIAVLRVFNGAEDDTLEKVSSSIIKINGTDIFTQESLNQNVSYLEKDILLNEGDNSIAVEVRGKPGGTIRLEVDQELEDSDGDGVPDVQDGCPEDPNKTEPGECGCGVDDIDADADGVMDCNDSCLNTPNGETVNTDGCSSSQIDSDNDGVVDSEDTCPGYNDNIDVDGDLIPDGCDDLIDSDGDGVADTDDQCPGGDDRIDNDNDGVVDCLDACPDTPDGEDVNVNGCTANQGVSEIIGTGGWFRPGVQ